MLGAEQARVMAKKALGHVANGKEDAYREYCEYLSNAWRRGR